MQLKCINSFFAVQLQYKFLHLYCLIKTYNMATVNFLYRSEKKDHAFLHLRLLYRISNLPSKVKKKETNEIVDFPYTDFIIGANTKENVLKTYWEHNHVIDKKTKKIKGTKDVDLLNKRLEVDNKLNDIKNHVLKAFNNANPIEVNKDWLQTQIDYYYNPPTVAAEIPNDLVNYVDYYIEARRHQLKPVMVKRCNVIKNKLIKYEKFLKSKILIENVNDSFKNGLLDFEKKNQYSLSTIKRELVFIKTICTHAKKKGLKVSLELEDFSKTAKNDNVDNANKTFIFLDKEDLTKLENINPNRLNQTLEAAKDWLLISCYTAQRISDFMRFNSSMIRIQNGKKHIVFKQVKTGLTVSIPLHSKVIEILAKNNNEFPKRISDAKYNEYIKEVCRIAKIEDVILGGKISNLGTEENPIWRKEIKEYKKYELICSHVGRRSYATNNFGKMPTSYLKTITSHKTEEQLLIYCGKNDKDKLEELFKYFQ